MILALLFNAFENET